MTVKIELRRDYELYITKKVSSYMEDKEDTVDTPKLKDIVDMLMDAFDDGVAFSHLNLKVEV